MSSKAFLVAGLVMVMAPVEADAASLLVNGGFETGDFTGWDVSVYRGSEGAVSVMSGVSAPFGLPVSGPSEGNFHAVTGAIGPGAYALSQGFTVPQGLTSLLLSFDLFAKSEVAAVDGGLAPFLGVDTQHVRVDILEAGANAFTTDRGIVATLLSPFVDDWAFTPPYTSYTFDLTSLLSAGASYEIRFAQGETLAPLSMGVDNVSLVGVSAIPLPATVFLLGGGLALLGGLGMSRRRIEA